MQTVKSPAAFGDSTPSDRDFKLIEAGTRHHELAQETGADTDSPGPSLYRHSGDSKVAGLKRPITGERNVDSASTWKIGVEQPSFASMQFQ